MFCDFENGDCNFEIGGSGEFTFSRKKGSETTPDIFEDHKGNGEGVFLFAKALGISIIHAHFTVLILVVL